MASKGDVPGMIFLKLLFTVRRGSGKNLTGASRCNAGGYTRELAQQNEEWRLIGKGNSSIKRIRSERIEQQRQLKSNGGTARMITIQSQRNVPIW